MQIIPSPLPYVNPAGYYRRNFQGGLSFCRPKPYRVYSWGGGWFKIHVFLGDFTYAHAIIRACYLMHHRSRSVRLMVVVSNGVLRPRRCIITTIIITNSYSPVHTTTIVTLYNVYTYECTYLHTSSLEAPYKLTAKTVAAQRLSGGDGERK